MPNLTPDQIQQLHLLGLELNQPQKSEKLKSDKLGSNFFPLLSISGITLLSFSGLILLKNKNQNISPPINNTNTTLPETSVSPTQVPKSIQHYLLTSQQYFSSALQSQSTTTLPKSTDEGGPESNQQTLDLLNQSILAATQAIKEFPSDYRGFFQRGRIYQSLLSSQPQLIDQALTDLTQALKLNPTSSEITRSLASLYAFKGDAQNTINLLSQTISIEPTKAQNFYDLAKIQQQVGLLPDALKTYNQLITLITDPTQKSQIESEKSSLEKLIAQNVKSSEVSTKETPSSISPIEIPIQLDSPTIQALASSDLIIAAPETIDQVTISNITDSNALSGTATLPANQTTN